MPYDLKTMRLFAAIFLDGEIGGTPLEGLGLADVADNFLSFLKQYSKTVADVASMQRHLEQISRFSHLLEGIPDPDLPALAIEKELQAKKDVFFPGGWTARPSGHAMLYRLFYQHQDIIFLAYNTGAGAQYHKKVVRTDLNAVDPLEYKEKFIPVYAIRFKDNLLFQRYGGLKTWIKKLLEPQILPSRSSDYQDNHEAALYLKIFPLCHYIGGELVDPELYYSFTTQGQRNGVCAQLVVEKMLRSFFKLDLDYDRFHLDYRLQVLHDYLDNKKIPQAFKKEFKAGWENTARMIHTGKGLETTLSLEDKALLVENLNSIRFKAKNYFNSPYNPPIPESKQNSQPAIGIVLPYYSMPLFESHGIDNQESIQTLLRFNPEDGLIQAIYALKKESKNPDREIFVYNLEQLCLIYCKTIRRFEQEDLAKATPIEVWEEALHLLEQYQIAYFDHYFHNKDSDHSAGSEGPAATARQQLMALGLMSLVHYVVMNVHVHFLSLDELKPLDQALAAMPFWLLFEKMKQNVFLSSIDPQMSYLLTHLKKFYHNSIPSYFQYTDKELGRFLVQHWANLLNSPPCLKEKKALEEVYKTHLNYFRRVGNIDNFDEKAYAQAGVIALVLKSHILRAFSSAISIPTTRTIDRLINIQRKAEQCIRYGLGNILYPKTAANFFQNEYPFELGKEEFVYLKSYLTKAIVIVKDTADERPRYSGEYITWNFSIKNQLKYLETYSASKQEMSTLIKDIFKNQANQDKVLDSNSICLLEENSAQDKELWHLRNAPSLQAMQVLDHFIKHMHLLESTEKQIYMFLSLFQPSILHLAMEKGADLVLAMESLYQKGVLLGDLKQEGNALSNRGLFLLKIVCYVLAYILSSESASFEYKKRSRTSYQRLEQVLRYWLHQTKDLVMHNELQRLMFYTLMHLYSSEQLSEVKHFQRLKRLVYARFYIAQHHEDRIAGMSLQAEDENFKSLFFKFCHIQPKGLELALEQVLEQLLPEQAPYTLAKTKQSTYRFKFIGKNKNTISIDFLFGRVSLLKARYFSTAFFGMQSNDYVSLSAHVAQNLVFNRVFGPFAKILALQINTVSYQFQWGDESYLFSDNHLYKQINEQWYQYQFCNFLPLCLHEEENFAWVNQKRNHALIVRGQKQQKIYEWRNSHLLSIEPAGLVCLQGPVRDQLLNLLNSFEKPSFIRIIQLLPLENEQYVFDLPRYRLSGRFDPKHSTAYIELNKARYRITNVPSLLKTGLMISNSQSTEPFDCLLLMPVQLFYTKQEIDDGHYLMHHDIHQELRSKESLTEEEYVVYRFDSFGKPSPQSHASKDILYLIYIYCAFYEWDKAHALLEQYVFEDKQDIRYLMWLCEQLPARIPNQKVEALSNSELLSLQLKALSKLLHLPFDFMQRLEKEAKEFIDKLPQTILSTYRQYHLISNHLHDDKKLSKDWIESLAKEVYLLLEKKVQDAQERLRRLNENAPVYTVLIEEINHYKNLQSQGYLAFILAKNILPIPFNFYASEWVNKAVTVPLIATDHSIEDKVESLTNFNPSHSSAQYRQACEKLSLDIGENTLFSLIGPFFALILDNNPANDYYRLLLKDFCTQSVLANAAFLEPQWEDKKPKVIFNILMVFLHALEQPQLFKRAYENTKIYYQQFSFSPSLWTVVTCIDGFYYELKRHPPAAQSLRQLSYADKQYSQTFKKPLAQEHKHSTAVIPAKDDLFSLSLGEMSSPLHAIVCELQKLYQAHQWRKDKEMHRFKALTEQEKSLQYDLVDKGLDNLEKQYKEQINDIIQKIPVPLAKKALFSRLYPLSEAIVESQNRLKQHASYLPSHLTALLSLKIKQLAGKQSAFSIDRLLMYYAQGLDKDFLQKRLLAGSAIDSLQKNLSRFLRDVFLYRQYQRLLKTVRDLGRERKAKNQYELRIQCAQQLLELVPQYQHSYQAAEVFQYQSQKSIRQEQFQFIQKFLSNKDHLGQLIMGGGKTKVILPLLAFLKANGKQLSIIMVPHELIQTNYPDLKRTLKETFGMDLELFHFDRKSPFDPVSLQRYLSLLDECVTKRKALMTDPSSIPSLRLKWRELLNLALDYSPSSYEYQNLCKQIDLLKEILLRFRAKDAKDPQTRHLPPTAILVDEPHKVFNIRLELNYSIGKKQALDSSLIRDNLDLFEFLEQEPIQAAADSQLLPFNGLRLSDFLKQPDLLIEREELIPVLMDYYAKAYAQHKPETFGSLKAKQVLTNQWNIFLPASLLLKYRVDYGRSPDKKIRISVPYAGNDAPTTHFFEHPLKTLNCTVQMIALEGLDFVDFKQLLETWKKADQLFISQNQRDLSALDLKYRQAISLEKESRDLPQKLQHIDLSNELLLQDLYQRLKHNAGFMRHSLEVVILPNIEIYPFKLSSDAIDLASYGDSLQAFGGTLAMHPSFHDRLQLDEASSFGTKNYLKQLLGDKKTPLILSGEAKIEIMSCLIDAGAHMRGKSNYQVAQDLARLLKNTPKDFVLFFQENQLYALKVGTNPEELIPLPSTDPKIIEDHLQIRPEQYFIYYDQNHSTGIDIAQFDEAMGLVTVDITTSFSSFIQAVMRMRKLGLDQKIQIVLSPAVKTKLEPNFSLDALYDFLEQNERGELANEVFDSACKKIKHIVREDLDARLLKLDARRSIDLFKAFKLLLVDKGIDVWASLSNRKEVPEIILNQLKNNLLAKWEEATKSFKTPVTLLSECETIIRKALRYCAQTRQNANTLNGEFTIEQEQELNLQLQLKTKINNPKSLWGVRHFNLDWAKYCIIQEDGLWSGLGYFRFSQLWHANEQCLPTDWSLHVFASNEYSLCHKVDANGILPNELNKPTLASLFWQKNEVLRVLMLSQEEADIFAIRLSNGEFQDPLIQIWLETSAGFTMAGKKPQMKKNFQYRFLKQQIHTWDADVPLLVAQKDKLAWFSLRHFKVLHDQMRIQENMGYLELAHELEKDMQTRENLEYKADVDEVEEYKQEDEPQEEAVEIDSEPEYFNQSKVKPSSKQAQLSLDQILKNIYTRIQGLKAEDKTFLSAIYNEAHRIQYDLDPPERKHVLTICKDLLRFYTATNYLEKEEIKQSIHKQCKQSLPKQCLRVFTGLVMAALGLALIGAAVGALLVSFGGSVPLSTALAAVGIQVSAASLSAFIGSTGLCAVTSLGSWFTGTAITTSAVGSLAAGISSTAALAYMGNKGKHLLKSSSYFFTQRTTSALDSMIEKSKIIKPEWL